MKKLLLSVVLFLVFNPVFAENCPGNEVQVEGFGQSFVMDYALDNAKVTVGNLEEPDKSFEVNTDDNGFFSFCHLPVYHLTFT